MRKLFAVAVLGCLSACTVQAADDWVTVKGRIVWDKKAAVPKRVPLKATQDAELCAKDKEFLSEDYIVSEKTKGIKNVVVWLAPEPTAAQMQALQARKLKDFPSFDPKAIHPALAKPSKAFVEIDQPCCRFIPHVLLAQEGQDLHIKNSAPVPHNAKWDSSNNGAVNPLLPAGGQFVVKALKAERLPIKLECSIHRWMNAYVKVFDHPYFALTDDDGNFEIKNAPAGAGKLRLFIWQETGGYQGGVKGRLGETIEVKAGTKDLGEVTYEGTKPEGDGK
jgi:hypothetical protein